MINPPGELTVEADMIKLTSLIRFELEYVLPGLHPAMWESEVKHVVDRILSGTGWEYMIRMTFGQPPKVALTNYDWRKDKR
jgi:hypothetical protein